MPDLMIERIVPWQLNGQKQSAFLCTPEHLDELAAGYLYTQGMIAGLGDIAELAGDENGLNVTLREGVAPRRTDILERLQACPACKSDFQAPLVQIQAMCRQLLSEKNYFGTHRLALHCGDQVAYREDVGRHNAADKCIAYGLRQGWDMSRCILGSTGAHLPGDAGQGGRRGHTGVLQPQVSQRYRGRLGRAPGHCAGDPRA